MKNSKSSVIFPVFKSLIFLALTFAAVFMGCGARVDLIETLTEESVPDINIKIGYDCDLKDGIGQYEFGSVQVDSSKPITFTLENNGEMPLTITEVYLTSENIDQFDVDLSQTSLHLEPHSSTTFTITFKPEFEGNISAVVIIKCDDPDEGTYTFIIHGQATPIPVPDIVITNESAVIPAGSLGHDFGNILTTESSLPIIFTVDNDGTADLILNNMSLNDPEGTNFSLDTSAMSSIIAPGESSSLSVVFSPYSEGQKSATVIIENNDPEENAFTFTIQGYGELPAPNIQVKKGEEIIPEGISDVHDFGMVMIGDTGTTIAFNIENNGTADLNLFDISCSNPQQFVVDNSMTSPVVQKGGGSTTFTLSFQPEEPDGSKSAAITISSDDPEHASFTFTVTGYATPIPVPEMCIYQGAAIMSNGSGSYTFFPVEIGQAGSPVTFAIKNNGSADLNISSITSSNPSTFTIDLSSTATTLPPNGGTTYFTVSFSPEGPGIATETVTITSDDPDDNPYSFTVEGEAAVPDIHVKKWTTDIPDGSTGAHNFGTVLTGNTSSSVPFTIENHGVADLTIVSISLDSGDVFDFIHDVSSVQAIVQPGGNTTFTISFSPVSSGAKAATVRIVSDDPDEQIYNFTVTGTAETPLPDIHVRQDSVNLPDGSVFDFGALVEGTGKSVIFQVRNRGTDVLVVDDISIPVGDFTLTSAPPTPFTVAVGSSTTFTVDFIPSSPGDKSAEVTILSNDPDAHENPYVFTLEGYGIAYEPYMRVLHEPMVLINGSGVYSFGHVQEGDSRTETFTMENNGTAPLIVSGILLTSGDTSQFSIDYSFPPIQPGEETYFTITFSPTFPGDKSATVSIVSNDDLYTFDVEGMVGTPPTVNVSVWEGPTFYPDGSTFDLFGTVATGSSSFTYSFTIINSGPDDLVIPNIAITDGDILDFEVDLNATDLNTPIPPGWSTTFSVSFTPQSSGDKWLDMNINYNDPFQTPYRLRFEGTGG
jgi:uncharacterized membrane protein